MCGAANHAKRSANANSCVPTAFIPARICISSCVHVHVQNAGDASGHICDDAGRMQFAETAAAENPAS